MIETVFPFFLILLFGTLLSQFFSKLHVPWVVALIVTGMLLGQSGLGVVSTGPALAMASDFGLIVLMCIAGLEIRTNGIVAKIRGLSVPLIVTSVIPFVLGAGVVHLLGYDWTASLLVGVVAMSSSVALVAPIIEGRGLAKLPIGQKILTVAVVQDIMSLVGLSLVMRHAHASLTLSFPVFLLALAGIILFFFIVVPRIPLWLRAVSRTTIAYESDLRLVLVLLLGAASVCSFIGIHPAVIAFFVGAMLAHTGFVAVIRSKLHVLAYSFFIPLFFVSVGLGFDSAVLYGSDSRLVILSIVGIVLVSKCLSGFSLIKSEGGSMYEAGLFGASIMAHLSTPLVIAYAGVELGIFDETLKTALVFLTIASALVVPIIVEYFAHRVIDQYAKDTTC